ncbi:MAG: CoA-binding protein [Dehalococcoidia bacterium]|jgi:acyl-CoA synthetase (NDP forming)
MDLVSDLERIFHPRGVAIIGASNRPGNLGGFFLGGFLQQGYDRDQLYAVHPTEKEVSGVKAYPAMQAIPHNVDLALVFSPCDSVKGVVADCVAKGVKGVIICTSGFAENGGDGIKLQGEIAGIARAGGVRIIGPNCVGVYCPESKLINYAGWMPRESGPVGMFSHSGSMTVSMPVAASIMGIHFSKVISCGNECDLNAADFLEYFGRDPKTGIVIGYVEGIKDGRRFFRIAREVSKNKPILLWKGGTSDIGSRSAASHTGALAVKTQVWDAVCKQAGIIKVDCEDDMLDYLQAFYYLPRPRGNRVAIVSATGGLGVAMADACSDYGLELAALSQSTRNRLQGIVPSIGTCVNNPVDIGMMSSFNLQMGIDTVRALAQDEGVDIIIKTVGTSNLEMVSKEFEALAGFDKPMIYIFSRAMMALLKELKPVKGVAIYSTGRRAVQVMSKMLEYERYRSGK